MQNENGWATLRYVYCGSFDAWLNSRRINDQNNELEYILRVLNDILEMSLQNSPPLCWMIDFIQTMQKQTIMLKQTFDYSKSVIFPIFAWKTYGVLLLPLSETMLILCFAKWQWYHHTDSPGKRLIRFPISKVCFEYYGQTINRLW